MAIPAKTWKGLGAAIAATLAAVFALEGGYVDNPQDPGGVTNHGITQEVARNNGYKGNMRELPRDFAEWVYTKDYVQKPGFDKVLALSPPVGHKLIDVGVNAGPSRSARWFQESLNSLSRSGTDYPQVTADGQIGPRTVSAYQALERRRGRVKACEMTLKLMDVKQGAHYLSLNMPTFTVGWVDNRIGNVALGRCSEVVLP